MPTHTPFTAESRQQYLQKCFAVMQWLDDFETHRSSNFGKPNFRELLRQQNTYIDQLLELRNEYITGVPIIPLSRCPYCQTINYLSFDHYGLDGLWWRADERWRNKEQQQLCPHFWTLSGAVRLKNAVASVPFKSVPGPEVPFVVSSALQHHAMQVVVSQIRVGTHFAYPTVYFSETKPLTLEKPFPEWSLDWAVWVQENNRYEAAEGRCYELKDAADFNLAPWIEQGQVWWIEPEDESFTLQKQVETCPYLNLPGRKQFLYAGWGHIHAYGEKIQHK